MKPYNSFTVTDYLFIYCSSFNYTVSNADYYILSDDRMTMNDELEIMWKKATVA
jgi:hypothetical protein